MRSISKLLIVASAAAAAPMLAAVTLGGNLSSSDRDDSDGAFIDPGGSEFSSSCWDSTDTICTVNGEGFDGGGGGVGGGGSGGAGTRDCENTMPTPEVTFSCMPGGGGSDPPSDVANPTPCVTAPPAAATLQQVNNAAKAKASELSRQPDPETGRLRDLTLEWGTILYVYNGQLLSTPFVKGTTDEVNWNNALIHVPNNAVIVGTLHHHPDVSGIRDPIP